VIRNFIRMSFMFLLLPALLAGWYGFAVAVAWLFIFWVLGYWSWRAWALLLTRAGSARY
jgi:hypothetical protein